MNIIRVDQLLRMHLVSKATNLALEVRKILSAICWSSEHNKLVAAEYLAKGYILSDNILERAIEMDSELTCPCRNIANDSVKLDKQGISKRFLSYFSNLDKSVGERALGPDQTISGKLQSTVDKAVQQARTVDEEKGYLRAVQDVRFLHYSK